MHRLVALSAAFVTGAVLGVVLAPVPRPDPSVITAVEVRDPCRGVERFQVVSVLDAADPGATYPDASESLRWVQLHGYDRPVVLLVEQHPVSWPATD